MSNSALRVLAGAGAKGDPVYVDDVFSIDVWDGNGSARNITNGVDLSGEGGFVWIKTREQANNHVFYDTVRGAGKQIISNENYAETTRTDTLTAFNNNGYALGADATYGTVNYNGNGSYVGWTFRKAKGFFDVLTYTGDGSSSRAISHNLGSKPGWIIIKATSMSAGWMIGAGFTSTQYYRVAFSSGGASGGGLQDYNNYLSAEPTATTFSVGNEGLGNSSGQTYVAYLFANNEASYGENLDEAIIRTGVISTSSSGTTGIDVDLGFEPQLVLFKRVDSSADWIIMDTIRGAYPAGEDDAGQKLRPNTNETEANSYVNGYHPTPTGFKFYNSNNQTHIYLAIRRPHKPASEFAATDLFTPVLGLNVTSGGAKAYATTYPVDLMFAKQYAGNTNWRVVDRIRAGYHTGHYLESDTADNEATENKQDQFDHMDGLYSSGTQDYTDRIGYLFRRAPGFCDVVGYTGTGSATTVSHNLGVVPELIIIKTRNGSSAAYNWAVYAGDNTDYLQFNTNAASTDDSAYWNDTSPTNSVFTVGTSGWVNEASKNFIAYLFATVDGISKIGTYTGTGSDVTVDCGFSSGARFVFIKRTNSTGHWIVLDSVRGITTGSDPAILFDELNAQSSRAWIKPDSSGFIASDEYNTTISGAEYIFFAIA